MLQKPRLVPQDTETKAQFQPSARFYYRYAYARSSDSRINNDSGQDFIAFVEKDTRLAFAVCDGVSQSFYGDLASGILGQALVDWFIQLSDPLTGESQDYARLVEFLQILTGQAGEVVNGFAIPGSISGMVRTVLEKKRSIGSESTFVAGLMDLQSGTYSLAWMGDSRLRLWDAHGQEIAQYRPTFKTAERWSSRKGLVGQLHCCSGRLDELSHLMVYSDGLARLDPAFVGYAASNQAVDRLIEEAGNQPTSDDISLFEWWAQPPQFSPAPPQPSEVEQRRASEICLIQWQAACASTPEKSLRYELTTRGKSGEILATYWTEETRFGIGQDDLRGAEGVWLRAWEGGEPGPWQRMILTPAASAGPAAQVDYSIPSAPVHQPPQATGLEAPPPARTQFMPAPSRPQTSSVPQPGQAPAAVPPATAVGGRRAKLKAKRRQYTIFGILAGLVLCVAVVLMSILVTQPDGFNWVAGVFMLREPSATPSLTATSKPSPLPSDTPTITPSGTLTFTATLEPTGDLAALTPATETVIEQTITEMTPPAAAETTTPILTEAAPPTATGTSAAAATGTASPAVNPSPEASPSPAVTASPEATAIDAAPVDPENAVPISEGSINTLTSILVEAEGISDSHFPRNLVFAPDGRHILALFADQSAGLYRFDPHGKWTLLHTFEKVIAADFTAGKLAFTDGSTITRWTEEAGQWVQSETAQISKPICALAFAQENLLTLGLSGEIWQYSTLSQPDEVLVGGSPDQANDIAYNCKLVAEASLKDPGTYFYAASYNNPRGDFYLSGQWPRAAEQAPEYREVDGAIVSLEMVGNVMLFAKPSSFYWHDFRDPFSTIKSASTQVNTLAAYQASGGVFVVLFPSAADQSISAIPRCVNIDILQQKWLPLTHQDLVTTPKTIEHVFFSPDGKYFFTITETELKMWFAVP